MFDVAVVGGGPAGAQAAISAATEGFKTALFEGGAIGGQIATTPHLENLAGYVYGVNGPVLARTFEDQAVRLGVRIIREHVHTLKPSTTLDYPWNVNGEDVRAVIAASGKSFRRLDIPGVDAPEVRIGPKDVFSFDAEGKSVIVVGGGNSAGQAIVHLGERAEKVYVITPKLKTSDYLTRRIRSNPRVRVIEGGRVMAIHRVGEDDCKVEATLDDGTITLNGCRVYLCVGVKPNTEWIIDQVALDEHGYIRTDEKYQTDAVGIYAIGDVRSGAINRVPSVMGEASNVQPYLWDYLTLEV